MAGTAARGGGQLVFAVGYLGAILLIVSQAIRGHSSVGDVVLVISLAAQVNQQTAQVVSLLHDLQAMAKAFGRLRWLQEVVRTDTPDDPAPPPERLRDGITLERVRFSYPGTEQVVLEVDELRLPAGSTLAIVGENGAGKTTLVKLLCRFYDPQEGRILVDETELTSLELRAWRDRIASGFQDFARLELLARQTVGVGDLPSVDVEEAVNAALARAHAHDVVDLLPDGLGTQLGKAYADGAELSGGQWQKLALGRAMMRAQPLLLVLDEPTAALDAMAEHALFERYAEGAKRVGEVTGAVTVLMSHRFATVRMADLIVVIDGGRVREQGSHGAHRPRTDATPVGDVREVGSLPETGAAGIPALALLALALFAAGIALVRMSPSRPAAPPRRPSRVNRSGHGAFGRPRPPVRGPRAIAPPP